MESVELRWDLLGAKLALLGDDEQSQFFKGFAHEMGKYESSYKREMQMLAVANNLNKKEKEILQECLSCLWFKEG